MKFLNVGEKSLKKCISSKKITILMLVLLVCSMTVAASMMIPANDRAKEKAKAPEHSPVIGENWDLERVDFIHYAKPDGKPGKPTKTESCYKLLGVKWKTLPVSYTLNPTNPDGLSEEFITTEFSTSASVWDAATSTGLFSSGYEIDYTAQYGVQDFQNSIEFGDHADSNVIAVTSIWYMRKGKQIVEFDMQFNTDFIWGDATLYGEEMDIQVVDFQNIATHELGHAVGMDDIYSDACSAVTMYGYSGYGELQKRTLEQPDVNGLQSMYG